MAVACGELIARRRLACLARIALSEKATPKLSFERHATRHLCGRLWGVMHSMNSSGTVATSTPTILAPPLEKLLTMHSRAKRPSQTYILAGEFHSIRKVFR